MLTWLLAAAVVAPTAAPPTPVAIVLDVSGTVTLEREASAARALRRQDLLRVGDRLNTADGSALLVWLEDGHQETLQPNKPVSLEEKGCTPADAVKRQDAKLAGKNLGAVRELAHSGRLGGTVVFRSMSDGAPQWLSPIPGGSVLADRPKLSWPEVPGAASYRVSMVKCNDDGTERRIWSATANGPALAYPEKERPLTFPGMFRWRVEALPAGDRTRPVYEGLFWLPAKADADRLSKLNTLSESASLADVLLAALVYDGENVYDVALPLYEKLSTKTPNDAGVQARLAFLYTLAGRPDLADKARKRADELKKNSPKD